jgi:hypothetical protein
MIILSELRSEPENIRHFQFFGEFLLNFRVRERYNLKHSDKKKI